MKVLDPKKYIETYLTDQSRRNPDPLNNTPEQMHNAILEGAARYLEEIQSETDYCWADGISEKNRGSKESAVYDAVERIELEGWNMSYSKEEDMKIIDEIRKNLRQNGRPF